MLFRTLYPYVQSDWAVLIKDATGGGIITYYLPGHAPDLLRRGFTPDFGLLRNLLLTGAGATAFGC